MTDEVMNNIVAGGQPELPHPSHGRSISVWAFSSRSTVYLFWSYLGLVAGAELLTSLISPTVGMIAHMLLLVGLLAHSALGRTEGEQKLALALTLAPMIRLLSLSMPLIDFPKEMWFPLVSVPLLLGTVIITRQIGMKRKALGLRLGHPLTQALIMVGGVALGVTEYAILRPEPLVTQLDWQSLALAALSLLIFTGFNEEIIFRGLMQSTALPVLGSKGVMYVALLFGVLHIGYLSIFDFVFVCAVGLLFGYLVLWSGSLLGVALAHGVTNITLFLVMPHLAQQGLFDMYNTVVWAGAVGGILVLGVTFMLWKGSKRHSRTALGPRKQAVRFPLPSNTQIPRFVQMKRTEPEALLVTPLDATSQTTQSATGTQGIIGAPPISTAKPLAGLLFSIAVAALFGWWVRR